ncbi:MAG: 3-deoxy-8-phosphooctulonate synthase [Alphaproteobacteria bacterium]|nr:3-deoxy-8-phosphooctulonate synthase [Alphaproteobacteria bacterium]
MNQDKKNADLTHGQNRVVAVGALKIANHLPFTLIAGPCVIESRDHALEMAAALSEISQRLRLPLIYKSSFDKANRSSLNSERGLGIDKGLEILAEIKSKYNLPILTDIHNNEQCEIAAQTVDVLQIPAFLCRQTDLLLAAGRTGLAINIKKGQFLAPWDMVNIVAKFDAVGNRNLLLCERGASFGYNTLVSDMRSLPIMARTGCPIVFDATHSVQQPGGLGEKSGGQREFVPVLARAAVAIGVAAVFIETHQDPDHAPSDGPNMIALKNLAGLLTLLQEIDIIAKANPIAMPV